MSYPNATSVSQENEVAVYCKITNFDGLAQARQIIEQEQYELKSDRGGKIRVRKETVNGIERYTQTIKAQKVDNVELVKESVEFTIDIDREYFDAFKVICTSGMRKVRYIFPFDKTTLIDDAESVDLTPPKTVEPCFEVDVYSDAEGKRFAWCKVDIELDSITKMVESQVNMKVGVKITAKMSELPFKPIEMFMATTANAEQKELLDELYSKVFKFPMSILPAPAALDSIVEPADKETAIEGSKQPLETLEGDKPADVPVV